jgi:hypothetical protein
MVHHRSFDGECAKTGCVTDALAFDGDSEERSLFVYPRLSSLSDKVVLHWLDSDYFNSHSTVLNGVSEHNVLPSSITYSFCF